MNEWIATADELPDDEQCVLIALEDGEVWTGYHESDDWLVDASQWYYPSADKVGCKVTHWMNFPDSPNEAVEKVSSYAHPAVSQNKYQGRRQGRYFGGPIWRATNT